MRIIRKRAIVDDDWSHVADGDDVPADGDVTVSLDRWQAASVELAARTGRTGVRLPNTVDPDALHGLLDVPLVAVEFPVYRDGRGFSIGRMLRRAGFTGELRAVGNVLRDQLAFMERCGYDSYEIEEGKSLENALEAFGEIGVTYQDAIEPRSVPRGRRWQRA